MRQQTNQSLSATNRKLKRNPMKRPLKTKISLLNYNEISEYLYKEYSKQYDVKKETFKSVLWNYVLFVATVAMPSNGDIGYILLDPISITEDEHHEHYDWYVEFNDLIKKCFKKDAKNNKLAVFFSW